jgi:hypothetical protein
MTEVALDTEVGVCTKTVKAGAFCKEHDGELEVTRRIEYGESIESMKLNTLNDTRSVPRSIYTDHPTYPTQILQSHTVGPVGIPWCRGKST